MYSLHETQAQTIDDGEDITDRLVTLVPARPPRNINRLKVQKYLTAILTARNSGNAWVDIAHVVGMKPDALRKAVAHFTAARPAPVKAPTANKRTDDLARAIDPRVATESRPVTTLRRTRDHPQNPSMHAGLRRKDAWI